MKILVLLCEKNPIHALCKLLKIIARIVIAVFQIQKNHKVSLVTQHQPMLVKTVLVNKITFFFFLSK